MNRKLTNEVKAFAQSLGCDLVGFANIERYKLAPIKMSPQGILPSAKTVIVCAVHHPDATIELEGGEHGKSQVFESYAVQYTMNSKLDHISIEIARFLEKAGFETVPITASNIWRYRSYKELDAVFSPDISHIYSSVAAGLTAMGWNGIAISPEYGARNRFVSIITDAELEPTPLYRGEPLCDMCGECIRCCPTDAYRKECIGVKTISFDDITYKFANKNLWRCAWGEHFDLDLDSDIPDKITEKEILERVASKGRRGGEMGVCLKVCVPPKLRFRDEKYSPYNRRLRYFASEDTQISRSVYDMLCTITQKYHGDRVSIVSVDKFVAAGVDLNAKLPGAKTVIFVSAYGKSDCSLPDSEKWRTSQPYNNAQSMAMTFSAYDIAREIEKLGYDTMPNMSSISSKWQDFISQKLGDGEEAFVQAVLTNAPLETTDLFINDGDASPIDLKENLRNIALSNGADMIGVSSVSRIEEIKKQLISIKDGEIIFNAHDKNQAFKVFEPVVTTYNRKLLSPSQYMDDAKSVIVLAGHFPSAVSRRAGQPPAEAVGPYIFAQYQILRELEWSALEVVKEIRRRGHDAYMVHDLIGMGSLIGSPRDEYASPFDGTLEAAAAGLGEITYNGNLFNEKYGINQRFICVVTDAELTSDPVKNNLIQKKCSDCRICISECPMKALSFDKALEISIEGIKFNYIPLDTVSCQWASRYALTNRDGFQYIGSTDDYIPDGKITSDILAATLKKRDPVTKGRPGTAEICVTKCPLSIEY